MKQHEEKKNIKISMKVNSKESIIIFGACIEGLFDANIHCNVQKLHLEVLKGCCLTVCMKSINKINLLTSIDWFR